MHLTDVLMHLDYRLLLPLIARFPVPIAYRLADWRGRFSYRVNEVSRQSAMSNIERVFPGLSEPERERLVLRTFQVHSRDEMETFWYTRPPAFFERIVKIQGLDSLQQAVRSGDGVLLFSGHLGSTGLFFIIMGLRGIHLNIVGRPLDPEVNPLHPAVRRYAHRRVHWVESALERSFLLTGRGNYHQIRRRLGQGEIVMMLVDVIPTILKRTVPIQFLGRQAYFGDGVANLFRETGSRLFHWSIHQSWATNKHSIKIQELTAEVGVLHNSGEIMQTLAGVIEGHILSHPEDWSQWDSLGLFYRSDPAIL
ncbi:MAG: lysophospholipid acyltransferase family protein [Acidobacteriota bacterium]